MVQCLRCFDWLWAQEMPFLKPLSTVAGLVKYFENKGAAPLLYMANVLALFESSMPISLEEAQISTPISSFSAPMSFWASGSL